MREINFRVWSNRNKEMINVNECEVFLDFNGKVYTTGIDEYGDVEYCEVEDIELLQYTGLNDKNGKEIYEGDIIEGGYSNPLGGGFISKKYIIEYDIEKGGYMGHIIGHRPYGDTWIQFIKGKIIGNIYENADLLNTNTL